MRASACSVVPELLQEYGTLVRGALERYLHVREPRKYYYDLLADYPTRGGRMLRPSLCLATARVLGAPLERAVPSAVHVELMHNAILIHDDIEDESEERRGWPTLHRMHGCALAINAGDGLALLSLEPLLDNEHLLGPGWTARMLRETLRMARESAEGQALELGWRRDNVVDLRAEDYLQMVLRKTCWPTTIYPLRLGAWIGREASCDPDGLLRFGFFLGAAFQIQDDLLNLVGDATRYGKELSGDLCEGKRTLMLIHLLQHALPGERRQIVQILALPRSQRELGAVDWLRKLMEHHGSIDHARAVAHGLAGAAQHELRALLAQLPRSRDREFLEELPSWVIARA